MVGRESGEVRLRQVYRSTVNDEWHAYDDLDDRGRTRFSVHHNRKEWARDDDGDGVREVHSNTIEGFWLGRRNYLRPFRGVSKWCLDLYLAFDEAIHNYRRDFLGFLRRLLGPFTPNSP